MKPSSVRTWFLLHLLLVVIAVSGVLVCYNFVVSGDLFWCMDYPVDNPIDEGIPAVELITIVSRIETSQPGCRILAVEKKWSEVKITAGWITNSYRRAYVTFCKTKGTWEESSSSDHPIEGISPAELRHLLDLTASQADYVDQRILCIAVENGEVEIRTGETNYNVGGTGNILNFEREGTNWVQRGFGHWVARQQSGDRQFASLYDTSN